MLVAKDTGAFGCVVSASTTTCNGALDWYVPGEHRSGKNIWQATSRACWWNWRLARNKQSSEMTESHGRGTAGKQHTMQNNTTAATAETRKLYASGGRGELHEMTYNTMQSTQEFTE